jgi:hypothetical protein
LTWHVRILKSIVRRFADLSPGCKEAARLQSRALDHPLTRSQKIGLRVHLMLCKWCRRYGKQIAWLRAASRQFARDDPSRTLQSLSPEARARINRKIVVEKGGSGS